MSRATINTPGQAAIAEFCRKNHIRRLSLFGSVLRNDFTPQSDIDVLVEFEPGRTPGWEIVDMERELSRLFRHKVDLRTPQELHPGFRDAVIQSARVLHDAA